MEKKIDYSSRYRYVVKDYKYGAKVNLTGFLNDLHTKQLDMIDEAVAKSDLRDAREVLEYIRKKC